MSIVCYVFAFEDKDILMTPHEVLDPYSSRICIYTRELFMVIFVDLMLC